MTEQPQRSEHPVFAALYSGVSSALEAGPVGAARRRLLADARGVVVDLGAGHGANLPLFGSSATAVHLVEPDPHMIRRMPRDLPLHVQVHRAMAEALPLEDESVDTVVATLTLCTVADPQAAVDEIGRVLRADGQVLILEHVRALDPRLARFQDWLGAPWSWVAAGCRPNRDTAGTLAAAGFSTDSLDRFHVPGMGLAREWLTGRIVRSAG